MSTNREKQGEAFIYKIDALKKEIEARHIREFNKLYRRIGDDLINIVTNANTFDFKQIIQNYKPDYIYIFGRIYQDVKENGLGFGIRKQLNFSGRNIIELKSIAVEKEGQIIINNRFDVLYTTLLNDNRTKLVDNLLESEATYFEGLYTNAQKQYVQYLQNIQKETDKTNAELFLLAGAILKSDIAKRKLLQKRLETLTKQFARVRNEAKIETVKQFKAELQNNIPNRSESNAEYGVGRASSEIREAEYQAIKQSQVREAIPPQITPAEQITAGRFLVDRIKKVWWEKSQFIKGAKPRQNHLSISGSEADSQGNFYVGGYETPHPRYENLPAKESVRCRCEVEYQVL